MSDQPKHGERRPSPNEGVVSSPPKGGSGPRSPRYTIEAGFARGDLMTISGHPERPMGDLEKCLFADARRWMAIVLGACDHAEARGDRYLPVSWVRAALTGHQEENVPEHERPLPVDRPSCASEGCTSGKEPRWCNDCWESLSGACENETTRGNALRHVCEGLTRAERSASSVLMEIKQALGKPSANGLNYVEYAKQLRAEWRELQEAAKPCPGCGISAAERALLFQQGTVYTDGSYKHEDDPCTCDHNTEYACASCDPSHPDNNEEDSDSLCANPGSDPVALQSELKAVQDHLATLNASLRGVLRVLAHKIPLLGRPGAAAIIAGECTRALQRLVDIYDVDKGNDV